MKEVHFMRDYKAEFEKRVIFIKSVLAESGAKGIVYGNSGGKDSALVGILCKAACDNTVGVILPCTSRRNYDEDTADAKEVAARYNIETRTVDLTPVKEAELKALDRVATLNAAALSNIAPRLRMLTLYAVAAAENRLVAGTGNRSEAYVGYFTKWGDGAHDFNPIADLTVTEIYEFLRYLDAPKCVIEKAPSAALANIAPRLRMLTLYAIAATENRLVAGTGNKSEAYVGYFTKWGDGAHDFNPIADLTVTEIYEFLRYLDAPKCVIEKAPSAALFDGQTDETEMGVTYAELDSYLSGGDIPEDKKIIVERMHKTSEHKRKGISVYTYK